MPQGPFTYGCIAIAAVLIMLAGCSVGGVTARGGPVAATLSKGHQVVGAAISASAYPTIIVQKGVPVQWTLNARKGDLSDCNQTIVVPGLGIRKTLVSGANLVEFKAERAGVIPYSCWMGMIAGRIVVVENLSAPLPQAAFAPSQVCRVPTGEIAFAKRTGQRQVATIRLGPDGFQPAIVLFGRGLEASIVIEPLPGLSSETTVVEFPGHEARLDLSTNNREARLGEALADFTFRSASGEALGYARVVDDPPSADLDEVRHLVTAYRPASAGLAPCCGY